MNGLVEDTRSSSWRRNNSTDLNMNTFSDLSDRDADAHFNVPESVQQFLSYFRQKFREGNVSEVHTLYETSFNRYSERYFKTTSWPNPEVAAKYVDNDEVFLLFYKELYYRHIYSRLQPTLAQRVEAWDNYCDLFNFILNDGIVEFDLPPSWLWDITDEFIYQFETWCHYRNRLKNKTEEEIAYLKDNEHIWNVNFLLQYLHAMVNKSNICPWLLNGNEPVGSSDPDDDDFDYSTIPVYRFLGYFSIIGLLRVHCLLGDYKLALMVLQPLDFDDNTALFTRVTACYISLYYYMTFAFLMLRRYEDAVRVLGSTLLHIGRIKQHHTRSYQYEQIHKRTDQMLALLAISLVFSCQNVDESVNSMLREKFGDKILRMRQGEESVFEELFIYACPKFVSPCSPDYDRPIDRHMEASYLQTKTFMREVGQRLAVPEVKSFLSLYTSIELAKLAQFMETTEEMFRSFLLCFKHKTFVFRGSPGQAPAEGSFVSCAPVSFYVDNDVVRVMDTKMESKFGEYFLQHIGKLQDFIQMLEQKTKLSH
ncbi:hypothetical protein GpartN1_g413.t1 [Galdieria partita]|uniref:Eukaryotic translation initiation factor 3 subunit L n=1 Tax=Galdieria partita TaxID=83374 RepID=A0A9C7PS05_9RHOD|nr:hypothetical protein GpartN1_g413.t1 [Galdieria partita]